MEQDKEEYAKLLAKRAELAVKIIKILVCAALTVFAGLVVYAITLYALKADITENGNLVVGLIVFVACIAVLVLAVFAVIAYAYYNLNKLKKLK